MRGKGLEKLAHERRRGITPACAGKSGSAAWHRWACRDHPRVCGEKAVCSFAHVTGEGSPPRVRGKVRHPERNGFFAGITPARAGKRQTGRTLMLWSGDHPRVCEEKWKLVMVLSPQIGSPPRMRGKVRGGIDGIRLERITPACAGKSPAHPAACPVHQDHPRACGEKCPPGKFFFMTVGSPPPVRGKVPSSI